MIQEDKEILLRDLCARLSHGVKVFAEDEYRETIGHICSINQTIFGIVLGVNITSTERIDVDLECCKPYLFPLRSMTDEQKEELEKILGWGTSFDNINDWFYDTSGYSKIYLSIVLKAIEFFNRHHFDYNGLIEKSLALDATGLDIYN